MEIKSSFHQMLTLRSLHLFANTLMTSSLMMKTTRGKMNSLSMQMIMGKKMRLENMEMSMVGQAQVLSTTTIMSLLKLIRMVTRKVIKKSKNHRSRKGKLSSTFSQLNMML